MDVSDEPVRLRAVESGRDLGICSSIPVRVEGDIRLIAGMERRLLLPMTEMSIGESASTGGTNILWFDRTELSSEFYVLGWLRKDVESDRIVRTDTGAEIDYDALRRTNLFVSSLSPELLTPTPEPGYSLRIEHASLGEDRLVVRVDGIGDFGRRYWVVLSDPFGLPGCDVEAGFRSAPALSGGDGYVRAVFTGYPGACISGGGYEVLNSSYEIRASLIVSDGVELYSAVLSSDDFSIEMPAGRVTYGRFGDELARLANSVRAESGIRPVRVGDNRVAQAHAEEMLDGCYASHWNEAGLKPYMRRALAGGVHASAEVWVGTTSYCVSKGERRIVSEMDVLGLAEEAIGRWLESEAHRRVLLNPAYDVMNYGLAYDSHNWRVVTMFESDALEDNGTLVSHVNMVGHIRVSGAFTEEAYASGHRLALIEIRHDPPPGPLSRGRLARTSFYGEGELKLTLNVAEGLPVFVGAREILRYPDPHDMEEAPAPGSESEANALFEAARSNAKVVNVFYDPVPLEIETQGRTFRFAVDASAYLCDVYPCGAIPPGVYTVKLLASVNGRGVFEVGSDSLWIGMNRPELPDGRGN